MQAQMKLMGYVFVPMGLIFSLWLPASVQVYFVATTLLSTLQNVIFQTPAFRKIAGLPPLVVQTPPAIAGANTAAPIAAEVVAEKEGFIKNTLGQVRQAVHAAQGKAGNYVEEAKDEQERKNVQQWNEKREEEQKRKFKDELRRKR